MDGAALSGAQWFATLGVGGIIAAFMFMFYRRDIAAFTKLWQDQSDQNKDIIKELMSVIRDNTAALTKVVTTVDSLHRRLDIASHTGKFPMREPREDN